MICESIRRGDLVKAGQLHDVSPLAEETGFMYPVLVSQAVWFDCVVWTEQDSLKQKIGQSVADRLWAVVFLAVRSGMKAEESGADSFRFFVHRVKKDGRSQGVTMTELYGAFSEDPELGRVLLIMQPCEK